MTRASTLAGLVVALALALAAPAAAVSPPVLRVRSYQPFVLHGDRFKSFEKVTLIVDRTWVRQVSAGANGSFTTTFRRIAISRCDGVSVRATGAKGSHAGLSLRPLACPSVGPG